MDRLMLAMMRRPHLRGRALRLVDVLAALPDRSHSTLASSLVREYLRPVLPDLPAWQRIPLATALAPTVPDLVLARLARQGMRFIARRFIVESQRSEVDFLLDELRELDRRPSLDLLGEAVLSDEEADEYKRRYLRLLDHLGRHPLAGQRTMGDGPELEVSVKLSALTSQFNPTDPEGTVRRVRPSLEGIFDAARRNGVGVTIDAEQYMYRELIWSSLSETIGPGSAFADWPDVGIAVQAYLQDADDHIRQVASFADGRAATMRVRLVKGAYWDQEVIQAEQLGWPVPVYRAKGNTDRSFERITRYVLGEATGIRLAVASHNVRSHAYAEAARQRLNLPEGAVEHQTLYRTLDSLSRALPQMGWVARDYVPVGELVPGMAYLVRRILENTSQVGFLTQERLHEDPEKLLRTPQQDQEVQAYRRPSHQTGFVNTPAARLFDSAERDQFRAALDSARAEFGARLRTRIGDEDLEGVESSPSYNPSDPEEVVAWVHEAGPEETDKAIAIANKASDEWANRPLSERVAVGLRAAKILSERRWEAAAWVVHEGGRSWKEAVADVEEAIDHIEWNARQLQRLSNLIDSGFKPRGVVACIPPWNFPMALPAGMTSAALLTGNAVILKPAEQTPGTAQLLVDVFHQAGVPQEALICLHGRGETVGAQLVESPDVDMVAFTGSKAVGLEICRKAAQVAPTRGGIKKVVAEMGGKNAIVVFPDADMDESVEGILESAFGHSGQKCSACSRVLVHRYMYDRLKGRLLEAVRSIPAGPADDPATVINPMIDNEARQRVAHYADMARSEGRVLLDELYAGSDNRNLLGPMIYELATKDVSTARTAQEEIFGPILALIPFSTEEEAIRVVNDVPYGLTFGVFSRSPGTVARVVRAVEAGNVYVNRKITTSRVGIEPFGGFKLSGTGPKAGSEEYLMAFLVRRDVYRHAGQLQQPAAVDVRASIRLPVAWQDSGSERLAVLRIAMTAFLERMNEPEPMTNRASDAVRAVLEAHGDVLEPQPAVEVPGQRNVIQWDTPLGIGLVAADADGDKAFIAAYVFASLMAGNGVILATPNSWDGLTEALSEALYAASVPEEVFALAPAGLPIGGIADLPIHFAAVDLELSTVQVLNQVLSDTREDSGQRWIKRLITAIEGLRPSEPGFLRQFAHPKAVSIRTLRHGADLELL